MWWQKDDLADRLIANNAARPIPGMEKPDMKKLAATGWNPLRRVITEDPAEPMDAVDESGVREVPGAPTGY